jgi:hypothetical protein
MLLERVHHDLVSFTFEPNSRGKVKLVRSTTSGAQQPKYHALAVKGLLAEAVTGTPGHAGPPTTTVEFTLTSLGRDAWRPRRAQAARPFSAAADRGRACTGQHRMKLTKAIEALRNGNLNLGEQIRRMTLQEEAIHDKCATARAEWLARGNLLQAMLEVQALLPDDETIDFIVPGDYE